MFNGNFSDQLNKRNKNNSLKDIVFNRGVERETLRVSKNGVLSNLSHPQSLGSPLIHVLLTSS